MIEASEERNCNSTVRLVWLLDHDASNSGVDTNKDKGSSRQEATCGQQVAIFQVPIFQCSIELSQEFAPASAYRLATILRITTGNSLGTKKGAPSPQVRGTPSFVSLKSFHSGLECGEKDT